MTHRTRAALLAAALLLAWRPAGLAAGPRDPPDQVLVSAAASLTDAVTAIARAYQQKTGVSVVLNVGASSSLARQIVNGAPVDLFLSADEAQMDTVAKAGLLDAGSRVDLLRNQLVVVMPAGRARPLASAHELTEAPVRRVAMADPEAVPAGVYARRYLESLGLWSQIEPKVVPTLDVRAALAAVDSGNVDAGFVYRTDAAVAHGAIVVFRVPLDAGPHIVYPAALVHNAPHAAAARRLLAYLQGPMARAIFDRLGFITAANGR